MSNHGRVVVQLRERINLDTAFAKALCDCFGECGLIACEFQEWDPTTLPELSPRRQVDCAEALHIDHCEREPSWHCVYFYPSPKSSFKEELCCVVFGACFDQFVVETNFEIGLGAFSERQQDLLLRLSVALNTLALRFPVETIVFDNLMDSGGMHTANAPFDGESPQLYDGRVLTRDGGRMLKWLRSANASNRFDVWSTHYPISFVVWLDEQKSHAARFPYCLPSGELLENCRQYDWTSDRKRLEVRKRLWKCRDRQELLAEFGRPEFALGEIVYDPSDFFELGAIGIVEQFVYTSLVADSILVVREWRDGVFTVLGTEIEPID